MKFKYILVIVLLSAVIMVAGCSKPLVGHAVAGFSDSGCVDGQWWYLDGAGNIQGPFEGCTDFADPGKPWCATKTIATAKGQTYISGSQQGTMWKYCEKKQAVVMAEGTGFGGNEPVPCSDSDGGKDFLTKGTLTNPDGETYEDFCSWGSVDSAGAGVKKDSSDYVYEYYCMDSGKAGTVIEKCTEGTSCQNGACLSECQKVTSKIGEELDTWENIGFNCLTDKKCSTEQICFKKGEGVGYCLSKQLSDSYLTKCKNTQSYCSDKFAFTGSACTKGEGSCSSDEACEKGLACEDSKCVSACEGYGTVSSTTCKYVQYDEQGSEKIVPPNAIGEINVLEVTEYKSVDCSMKKKEIWCGFINGDLSAPYGSCKEGIGCCSPQSKTWCEGDILHKKYFADGNCVLQDVEIVKPCKNCKVSDDSSFSCA